MVLSLSYIQVKETYFQEKHQDLSGITGDC